MSGKFFHKEIVSSLPKDKIVEQPVQVIQLIPSQNEQQKVIRINDMSEERASI